MSSPSPDLNLPLTHVRGIGPERAALMDRLGLSTIEHLLLHRPRRYEDRRNLIPIRNLELGQPALISGRVIAMGLKQARSRARSVFEVILDDGTARLHCRWWNLPYMERYFAVSDEFMVFGRLSSLRPRSMDHPETEKLEDGEDAFLHVNRIVPIYPLTEGLSQRVLRRLVWAVFQEHGAFVKEREPAVQLPPPWPARRQAVEWLHFPPEIEFAERARQRLALDEFISLQFSLRARRRHLEISASARNCAGDNHWIRPFLTSLPFRLTDAQTRVLREIRSDLGGEHPMRRLLQGDVGSGKTVVAACAALMTLESGYNVVLMAPTQILAEQHALTFQRWFEPFTIGVELVTANTTTPARMTATGDRNTLKLTIGTHALLESGFTIDRLGLVIIDEQHKFGVAQRETLLRKGRYPHLLVMTATPIPRTLALTIYGDLDTSVLDQLPPGRGKIRTHVRGADRLPKVWEFVRRELDRGRQAYIVYPRVSESDREEVKAVTKEFARVSKELSPHQVGMLHGQLPAREKERVTADFRAGRIAALLATSVIEVGVDIPNATVMLIENAEAFGLAQLHQLRGRIGRSNLESHCILVADLKSGASKERLELFAVTSDGFELAESDLRIRGAGELLGKTQSGIPSFSFGDLVHDRALVELARDLVRSAPKDSAANRIE